MRQEIYDKMTGYIIENQKKFYRLAFSYAQNQEDALDIVQNAVLKALDHYESLKNPDAIKTWFYRILVNESIYFLKKDKKEIASGEELGLEIPYYEQGYEPSEDLYDEINQLDTETQNIIKLRFFEEMSLKEIAEITGANLNTVKARLYRGLKLLKQNIQEVNL
ncbi:RNA polymerase sigma factor [Lacrimispora indolis]|uniref:RNA polymerase sigma factor n=1 Tax=Lacrimispora indolis TaxID=69825 RepID=UPI00045E8DF8|nr:sigma-70 family RNA polymerase sigma factor [Lacrimispora indolis]MBE7721578.1 sigma-70 family RNA polymerase sigma factor [Lacrimispora celerecrescens]